MIGMMKTNLKTRVFQFADMRGWSLTQLAEKMEIDLSMVYRVKVGERGITRTFMLGAKRAFPDMDLDALFYVAKAEAEKGA